MENSRQLAEDALTVFRNAKPGDASGNEEEGIDRPEIPSEESPVVSEGRLGQFRASCDRGLENLRSMVVGGIDYGASAVLGLKPAAWLAASADVAVESAPLAQAGFDKSRFAYRRHKISGAECGPGGRPAGSGAATRRDLPHLVLSILSEDLVSAEGSFEKLLEDVLASTSHSSASGAADRTRSEAARLGAPAVAVLLKKAQYAMRENRARLCYMVEGMDGFCFVASYGDGEKLGGRTATDVENGVGDSRAAFCWVNGQSQLVCSCVGSSFLSVLTTAGTARDCSETMALAGAISSVAESLAKAWITTSPEITVERVTNALTRMLASCGDFEDGGDGDDSSSLHADGVEEGEIRSVSLFGRQGRLAVVIAEGKSEQVGAIAVPVMIPHPNRRAGTLVCCFCVTSHLTCSHIADARAMYAKCKRTRSAAGRKLPLQAGRRSRGPGEAEDVDLSGGFGSGIMGDDGEEDGGGEVVVSQAGLSRHTLPLVDCATSLERDEAVFALANSGGTLVVTAPDNCESCG